LRFDSACDYSQKTPYPATALYIRAYARRRYGLLAPGCVRVGTRKLHEVVPSEPVEGEAGKHLSEVAPREQAGAETMRRFDYQFVQAAGACLDLLEISEGECVFCEWHDDYVVERAGATCSLYVFHQVKTKKAALGPWSLNSVFGVNLKKPAEPATDAIAAHLLEHYTSFADQCVEIVFVTNTGFQPAFTDFVDAVTDAESTADLPPAAKKTFDKLLTCYRHVRASLTEVDFFAFLKMLRFVGEVGTVNPNTFHTNFGLLTTRIMELSEVSLKWAHALGIAQDLVSLVKHKSIAPISLPVTEEGLRKARAVAPPDVLDVLALSPEGYRTLRECGDSGRDAVRALSRLQRLCEASEIPPDVMPSICGMKTRWDLWERASAPVLSGADAIDLRMACEAILKKHANRELSWPQMSQAAADIATEFAPRIKTMEPLTRDLVLGFILAIASTRAS
jgi:hypothetical protein